MGKMTCGVPSSVDFSLVRVMERKQFCNVAKRLYFCVWIIIIIIVMIIIVTILIIIIIMIMIIMIIII